MPLSVNSQTKHNSSQLPCQLYVSVFAWVCCSEYVTSNGWFRPGEVYQVSMHKNTYTPSADVPPQVLLCAVIRSYSQGRKKFISLLWYPSAKFWPLLSHVCQPRSSRRASPSSQQFWTTAGFFCGWPCNMELVTRQSERSIYQQRLLQAFTEDVFIFSLLTYTAY